MAWFKLDDQFWSHPKTLQLSDAAVALWARAGSYSCAHLTDGFISEAVLRRQLGGSKKAVRELTTVAPGYEHAFWQLVDGGYQFHDWHEYQEASGSVKKRRSNARERMRSVRANRGRTESEQDAKFSKSSPNPDPTRPDPSSTKKRDNAASGARLSDDWRPSTELRAWAAEKTPHVNWPAETDTFRDYWTAQPGIKGRKTDWPATWRNWMRRKEDDHGSGRARKPTPEERALATLAIGNDLEEVSA